MAAWWDEKIPDYNESVFFPAWRENLELSVGDRVLEIGCGTGRLLPLFSRAVSGEGRVVGADFSPEMLKRAKNRFQAAGAEVLLCLAEARRLPFPNDSFSTLFIINTFPHLRPFRESLTECRRVLSLHGYLHIIHFAGRDHINAIHRGHGGAIGRDLLPPARDLARILTALDFCVETFQDEPTHYWIKAQKR